MFTIQINSFIGTPFSQPFECQLSLLINYDKKNFIIMNAFVHTWLWEIWSKSAELHIVSCLICISLPVEDGIGTRRSIFIGSWDGCTVRGVDGADTAIIVCSTDVERTDGGGSSKRAAIRELVEEETAAFEIDVFAAPKSSILRSSLTNV